MCTLAHLTICGVTSELIEVVRSTTYEASPGATYETLEMSRVTRDLYERGRENLNNKDLPPSLAYSSKFRTCPSLPLPLSIIPFILIFTFETELEVPMCNEELFDAPVFQDASSNVSLVRNAFQRRWYDFVFSVLRNHDDTFRISKDQVTWAASYAS